MAIWLSRRGSRTSSLLAARRRGSRARPSAIWATAYDFPALDNGWVVREVIPDGRSSGAQGFWLNLRKPHLQDPKLREALGYLFNFEWSNETLFSGLYERTDSFWENTGMQAEGLPEGHHPFCSGAAAWGSATRHGRR